VRLAGQRSGANFESITRAFLVRTFPALGHLRPGQWEVLPATRVWQYEQFAHLKFLDEATGKDGQLAAALGRDYVIRPDIVVVRRPTTDEEINKPGPVVNDGVARMSGLRESSGALPHLHASISCKWTIRSDRAQNSRTEALNLMRNRKGRLPHIIVVTGEPLPSRLESIALGTGDVDCVYHFALTELRTSVEQSGDPSLARSLGAMVDGKRLKDISDLPLDLAL